MSTNTRILSLFAFNISFTYPVVDKNGNQEVLRFPQFHPEVIDAYVWDAAETLGRIRVIISEGLSRPNRSPPFERVKDVVMFSFQHAPLSVYHQDLFFANQS